MPLDNSPDAGILDIDQIVHQARGRAAPGYAPPLPGAPAMPTGQPTALTPRQAPLSGPFGDIAPDIPLASRQVMAALSGPESGGRFNVLWTTPGTGPIQTFDDYSAHPKYQGWHGAPGPEGNSHAAGFLQWQPGTYDEGAALAGLQRGPNGEYSFAPNSQLKVGAAQTADTYKRLTGGRDMVADWNAGHHQEVMDVLHSAGSPWAQNNAHTDLLTGWSKEDRERYQTGVTNGQKLMNEYMQEALSKPEGSEERANALRLAEQHRQQAEEQYQRLQSMPPAYTPLSPLERFGSAGVLVALLGGLFAKQGLTAALGAAGSAMEAENTGNMEKYKTEMERWKASSEFALANAKLAGEDISRVIDEAKLSYDERNARLSSLASLYNMNEKLLIDDPIKYRNSLVSGMNAALEWKVRTQQYIDAKTLDDDRKAIVNSLNEQYVNDPANAGSVVTGPDGKKMPPPAVQAQNDAQARMSVNSTNAPDVQVIQSAVKEKDAVWSKAHDGAPVPADVHAQHIGEVRQEVTGKVTTAGALTDEAAQFMAKQYLAGDRSVINGLGYGNVGASNRAKLRDAIMAEAAARNMTPEQTTTAIAEFEGLKAGERTLGTTGARIGMGLAEAKVFAPMVLDASDKVSRTDYPKLNDLLLAYDKGTGDENVVRFGVAVNALMNAYSQVQTRGGAPTDKARETSHEIFDKAYSNGQMRAAVDQVMQEINAAQAAPGIVRQEMRDRQSGAAPAAASPAPSAGGVPVPADHASDPDGTRYHGSDGKTYVKRGGQMVPQ